MLTSNGLRKIEDIDAADVYSAYDDTAKKESASFNRATLIDNGIREVVKVDIRGSEPIVCTPDHRFLVARNNDYEWKEARELQPQDKLAMPQNDTLNMYKDARPVDMDFATAGWMIGDGWQCSYDKGETRGVCFGPADVYAQEVVIPILNRYLTELGCPRSVKTHVAENGVVSWASSSNRFAAHLEERFGIVASLSKRKVIPDKVMYGSSPAEQASFLGGLFSADGMVGNYSGDRYVALSSASEQLLYDVQALLRCFGIHGRVVYGDTPGRPGRGQGHLKIHGAGNLSKFKTHIGFVLSPAKTDKLSAMGLPGPAPKREWHSVNKVDAAGQARVYDLNVPTTHTFVANGAATHNCNLGSLCLPAFVVDGKFDYEGLMAATRVLARNLDRSVTAGGESRLSRRLMNVLRRTQGDRLDILPRGGGPAFQPAPPPHRHRRPGSAGKRLYEGFTRPVQLLSWLPIAFSSRR